VEDGVWFILIINLFVTSFWQAGKQLGRVTGLPAAVKLVVMMMMRTNTFYLNG